VEGAVLRLDHPLPLLIQEGSFAGIGRLAPAGGRLASRDGCGLLLFLLPVRIVDFD
jgi:hypothetical protein